MNNPTPEEQLLMLKATTIRLGTIHEAQRLQLSQWPYLIPGVTKAKFGVNFEKKVVKFYCESKALRPTKLMRLTCENICKWVRFILWDETKVVIQINKKVVFDSSKT